MSARIEFICPDAIHNDLRTVLEATGTSVSEYLRVALREKVKRDLIDLAETTQVRKMYLDTA